MDNFYKHIFNQGPTPIAIVKADYPIFTFQAVNELYRQTTGLGQLDVTGLSAFAVFKPESAADKVQFDQLQAAMIKAVKSNSLVSLDPLIFEATHKDGRSVGTSWWKVEIYPITDENNRVESLMCITQNVTTEEENKRALQTAREKEKTLYEEIATLNEELTATNEELHAAYEELQATNDELIGSQLLVGKLNEDLELRIAERTRDLDKSLRAIVKQREIMENILKNIPAGIAILNGYDFVLELVNGKMLDFWDRNDSILNMPLLTFMPELKDQIFPQILKDVLDSGVAYHSSDAPVEIIIEGRLQTIYMDFSYTPLFNEDNRATSILVLAEVVTERTLASMREQKFLKDLNVLNSELSDTNKELRQSEERLRQVVNELQASEGRFKRMIEQAPVAIGVLLGESLVIDSANKVILKLWGKKNNVIGLPIATALPEIEGQPFLQLLKNVFSSGESFYGQEFPALLDHDGEMVRYYFDFVYQAFYNEFNEITGVLVIATDVTKQVVARQELQNAKDSLDLALNAAELGTFDVDLKAGTMDWNERCRNLFGITHTDAVTYEHDFVQGLHPDDRSHIVQHISNYVYNRSKSDGFYNVEYRTVGFDDQKVRWIRAKGKTYFDESDQPTRFLGAILDITEQKHDEMRKNDFIGMVSHELKTPLTSINAYIQMLISRSEKLNDQFNFESLGRVKSQVKKMTSLINGFLNVSRLESGKIQIDKTDFDLDMLVKEQIEEHLLTNSGYSILFNGCQSANINADRDKLGSVISNLISNAIKYSPKNKEINLTCFQDGNMIAVSVKDQGIGIKKTELNKLFDRYYRVDDPNYKHISGFGIGLYLSSEIIKRHNGSIYAESEPGLGSTFTFKLPLNNL